MQPLGAERRYVVALLVLDALVLVLVLTAAMGWGLLIPAVMWTIAVVGALVWRARALRGPSLAERGVDDDSGRG